MALVVGKGIATGSFGKLFADLDMATEIDSTPLQDEFDFKETNDERIEKLAMEVKEVAIALREMSKDQLIVSHLYTEVMKTEGFDEITLATIFDYLVQNKMLAKAFIAKSATLRKVWVQNFINQHGGGSAF
ncbi:hypothetical protein DITRI_Ditri15bG0088000 [Diplodiscus trichospermus]